MKKFLLLMIAISLSVSPIYSESGLGNLLKQITGFLSSPFKKKVNVSIAQLETLDGSQYKFYIEAGEKIIKNREDNKSATANDYLEMSIIKNIKGDKISAKEYAEKVIKKDGEVDISSLKEMIKSGNLVEKKEDESFVFDEDLVMMLANEFSDQYEVSFIKTAIIQSKTKKMSDKDIADEIKKIADRYFSKISNTFEAKEAIEKAKQSGEYELALEMLEISYNKQFVDNVYYKELKTEINNLLKLRKELEQELKKKREEEEKRLKEEQELLRKIFEEEQKQLEKMKQNKWTSLLGTKVSDSGQAVAIGADGIYITGYTYGGFYGGVSQGDSDVYLVKLDFSGNRVWSSQFGSKAGDSGTGVAVGKDGIYVVGYAKGVIDNQPLIGDTNAFIAKYSFSGVRLWTKIFGSKDKDKVKAVSLSEDGVYIVGSSRGDISGSGNMGNYDIFVAKYNFGGNKLWVKSFGSANVDEGNGVAVLDNNVYVTGSTLGSINNAMNKGNSDIVVAKLSPAGNLLWTVQYGTGNSDYGNSVSAGIDGIYVTGETKGSLDGQFAYGDSDIFLSKFSTDGKRLWTRTVGSGKNDYGYFVFARLDSVYVTGRTKGSIDGQAYNGGSDIVLSKFDNNGKRLFTKLYGTDQDDECYGLCVGLDFYYIIGETRGKLNGQQNNGGLDVFCMMLTD